MSKIFPLSLFLVVILSVAVLCFAMPPQEQAASAYISNDTILMQYQVNDESTFENVPYVSGSGYRFQFDVNAGYEPFYALVVGFARPGGLFDAIEFYCEYFGGTLHFYSITLGLDIEYSTSYPFRLELVLAGQGSALRCFVLINTEYMGYWYYLLDSQPRYWSFNFLDENLLPYSYNWWSSLSSDQFTVQYTTAVASKPLNSRSWITDGTYDSGYIDGMNAAQTATVNIFPAFIGSIFAFFASIASYEILGISLLNIMIIVGSVLLLLAVLRVFLK